MAGVSYVPPFQPAMPPTMYRPMMPSAPPMLGTMGISAIVVAVLSILASLLTAGYAASVYLASKAARDRILRNAPLVMPVSTPRQSVRFRVRVMPQQGKHGLNEDQQQTAISAFEPLVQMTPQQAG